MERVANILDPETDPGNIIRIWIIFGLLKGNWCFIDGMPCVTKELAEFVAKKSKCMLQAGYDDESDFEILKRIELKKSALAKFYKSYEKIKHLKK